jgi:hypothetical protein
LSLSNRPAALSDGSSGFSFRLKSARDRPPNGPAAMRRAPSRKAQPAAHLIKVFAAFARVEGELLEEEIDSSLGFLRYDSPTPSIPN